MAEVASPSSPKTTILEVAVPRCAAEVMGDEVVALNVETGIYYSVRELGVAAWNDLASGHPLEDLSASMRAASGSDATLHDFVSEICRHGLMRAATAKVAAGNPTLSAALEAGQHEFVLEVFEDMKDLILSDPIHDVDEVKGWPSLAPGSR